MTVEGATPHCFDVLTIDGLRVGSTLARLSVTASSVPAPIRPTMVTWGGGRGRMETDNLGRVKAGGTDRQVPR